MALPDPVGSSNVIISGPHAIENDMEVVASTSIRPGYLIEEHTSDGVTKLRPNSSATEMPQMLIALELQHNNKTLTDLYAAGDYVRRSTIQSGTKFRGWCISGVTANKNTLLQSNGDGTFKAATATTADANLARFKCETNAGAVTELTSIEIKVI